MSVYDIAIVGGGPAGLSAALTGRIRNKSVLLFEHLDFSEKLQKAHQVNNYLGMPELSGREMMQKFAAHALSYGLEVAKEKVVTIFPGEVFTLLTGKATYEAKSVILATGVAASGLFAGEKELLGRGVSYCATCDGMLYRDQDVAVVSYTREGEHEAEYLAEICHQVYYLPQYKAEFTATRSNLTLKPGKPRLLRSEDNAIAVDTGKEELRVGGVFILRQSDPVETLLPEIELTGEVIKVDRDMATSIPGVFAAGDCTGKPWQISRATGEGLVAVFSAISYLDAKAKTAGA
ncbi:MAG: NAD(P)/FAD-dependent oxidoreductase [Sporomusaceae bacterium]|nr:NAD(P)/FAD-dependent oxidoreductase [Sporomusaceae bacterium]